MRTLMLLLPLLLASPSPAEEARALPELGDPAAGLLSPDQEYRLGRAWLRQLHGQVPLLNDPLVQEYVEQLIYRLASYSALQDPDLAIVVVNHRDINAFAVPGGVIGLNAGLILNAEYEDEVSAVLAHEIAHVSQKHFIRRYADSQRSNRAMMAALLASLALAVAGNTDAGIAGIMATQAAAIQQQLAYSRHHEREADRIGMQTLVNAGYDPQAMPRFFERLQRSRQFAASAPEFLSTHPINEERIADSRGRANKLTPQTSPDPTIFHLVKARLAAGFFADPNQAVAHFRNSDRRGAGSSAQANNYGLALSAMRTRQFALAEEVIQALRQQHPDQHWYRVAEAELLQARSEHAEAVVALRELVRLMPGNYAISAMLADSLIRTDQAAEAASLLAPILRRRPTDVGLWRLTSEAWGRSDQLALAHLARGEALFLSGATEDGLEQMRFALDKSKENFPLHSRIKARLREMDEMDKEKLL